MSSQPCLSERRGMPEVRGQPLTPASPAESPLPTSRKPGECTPFREDVGCRGGEVGSEPGGAGEALGFSLFWRSCWLWQPGPPASSLLSRAAEGGSLEPPGMACPSERQCLASGSQWVPCPLALDSRVPGLCQGGQGAPAPLPPPLRLGPRRLQIPPAPGTPAGPGPGPVRPEPGARPGLRAGSPWPGSPVCVVLSPPPH